MRRRTAILAILEHRHLWHQSQCWRGLTVIFYNGNISCLLMTRLCRYWPVWWTNSPTTLQLDPSQGGVPGMTSVRADPYSWDGRRRCGRSEEYWWSGSAIDIVDWYCQIQSRHLMFIGKNPCGPSSDPTVGLMPFSFLKFIAVGQPAHKYWNLLLSVLHSYILPTGSTLRYKSSYFIHLMFGKVWWRHTLPDLSRERKDYPSP